MCSIKNNSREVSRLPSFMTHVAATLKGDEGKLQVSGNTAKFKAQVLRQESEATSATSIYSGYGL